MAWALDLPQMHPRARTCPITSIDSRLPRFCGQSWRPPLKTEARGGGVCCRVLETAESAAGPDVDDSLPVAEKAFIRSSFVKRVQRKVTLLQRIGDLTNGVKERVLTHVANLLFKEVDHFADNHFAGNSAPVEEIAEKTTVRVVSGSIPSDFPPGVYIRNGPNPQFEGKCMTSPLGSVEYHAFEADGMLHAIYFEKGGKAAYLNRYVNTEGYKLEKERGRPVWLKSFQGDSGAIALSYGLNMLRFGKANKETSNTHVFQHAGRYFAAAEGDIPYEFNPSDLTTIGPWDGCNGQWNRPFSSHPLRDPETNEMVIFGFRPFKPYGEIAIWSADGDRLVQTIDLELDHCVFCHELAITRRFTIFFDFPLGINVDRLMRGGRLVEFHANGTSRVGILPRYGDSKSIKWFPVETGFSWHKVNSFEDGDEVVVIGVRSRRTIIPLPKEAADRKQWWSRGLQNVDPKRALDPAIDGALAGYIHEWRFNVVTGDVSERDLSGYSFSGEYPTINRSYTGVKNKYGYMTVSNVAKARETGVVSMGGWAKMTIPQSAKEKLKAEFHDLGTGWGVSEPSFVARPNSRTEDDGWVVAYVHNEEAGISYLYIIDAQNFSGDPVAKLQLPQRVPYGYHGTYFYEEEPEHVLQKHQNFALSSTA